MTRFPLKNGLEWDIQVPFVIFIYFCLQCCLSFNFFLWNKFFEDVPRLFFGVQIWSLPHSQIRGEIVTHLVKILKLYQLVEEEASKSSLFFLTANQSPSLSSSLRSRSRGHRIRVSTGRGKVTESLTSQGKSGNTPTWRKLDLASACKRIRDNAK